MRAENLLVLALLGCGCARSPVQEYIPAGPLVHMGAHVQLAVYFLPRPTADPMTALEVTLAELDPSLHVTDTIQTSPTTRQMVCRMRRAVSEDYAPPEEDLIELCGFGISAEQARAVQGCREALVLDFAYPREQVWTGLKRAYQVTETVARTTGGLVWDEETRQIFTPQAWREQRLDLWQDTVPDVSQHVTVHAYKRNVYVRAITLGMVKFGLPDMVVEDFSWSLQRPICDLMNLCCQAFAEGAELQHRGEFRL